jgi:hypothetical protein
MIEDPCRLVHLHIELEYQLVSDGFLVPFPGSSEQARFIIDQNARKVLPAGMLLTRQTFRMRR